MRTRDKLATELRKVAEKASPANAAFRLKSWPQSSILISETVTMTAAQIRKLETILGKLEALQSEVANSDVRARLGYGKSELIRALQDATRAQ